MELVKCLTKGQIDCTASLCWTSAASWCCCQVYLHFWLIFLIQKLMQKVFSNEKCVCQYSPLPLWISVVLLLWLLPPDLFIFWFAWKLKSSFSKHVVSFSRSFWEQKDIQKEKKNNLLWAASLYFWSEMNSQIKGYISSLPCDTKPDFQSLLLVQSDLEAEEVTLCKTVYDTHCCYALVLCIQSIESWTLFSLIENPS